MLTDVNTFVFETLLAVYSLTMPVNHAHGSTNGMFVSQLSERGVRHADSHPGNLMHMCRVLLSTADSIT